MSQVWGRMHSAKFVPAVITILVGAYIARDLAEIQFTILIFLGLLFNAGTLLLVCFLTPPSSFLRQNRHPTWIHVWKGWENIRKRLDSTWKSFKQIDRTGLSIRKYI